jgi:hypothetical protein
MYPKRYIPIEITIEKISGILFNLISFPENWEQIPTWKNISKS